MSSHKNQENSVIDAFLGLDISSLIVADVESSANPDLEHWEATIPVCGLRSTDTSMQDVDMVHEATGGLWMENKSDVKDDLKFWRQTSPDNKFRCHSNSEASPFSKMGGSCYVEKFRQDNSTFQQTEEEGVLGLRGLRKLSESLEDGKDGVYNEKDIAKKYEEEQPNIVKNIEHLLEDEELDQVNFNIFDKSDGAETNLDEVKLDIPEEWKSPFPSSPALETDENNQAFCVSPQTPHDSLLASDPQCFSSPYNYRIFPSDPSCFYSPSSSPHNSLVFTSDPSCFYSPSSSPHTSHSFTSNPSCFYSPCSSPQTPSYSQPISGYSSPVKDQSWYYIPSPPLSHTEHNKRMQLNAEINTSQPPFTQRPPPPAYGPVPPVDISGPAAASLKRNTDFTVYVHQTNAVPTKVDVPTSYAAAPRLDVPTSYAAAPRLDVPTSYAMAPRLDVPTSYAMAPRLDVPTSYAVAPRLDVPTSYATAPRLDVPMSYAAAPRLDVPTIYAAAPRLDVPTNYAMAPRLDVPTSYAMAPRLDVPTSYATAPRLDVPTSYATAPRLDVPTRYATAARLDVPTRCTTATRRSMTIPRLKSLKNLSVKAQICGFCRQNGERKEVFRSHNKADENGKVTCPYLASHACEICGATGENAHTKTYCPRLPKKQVPLPVALKNTLRKSDGKLRK